MVDQSLLTMFKVRFKGPRATETYNKYLVSLDPFLWWKRPCWQTEKEAGLGRVMESALSGAQF